MAVEQLDSDMANYYVWSMVGEPIAIERAKQIVKPFTSASNFDAVRADVSAGIKGLIKAITDGIYSQGYVLAKAGRADIPQMQNIAGTVTLSNLVSSAVKGTQFESADPATLKKTVDKIAAIGSKGYVVIPSDSKSSLQGFDDSKYAKWTWIAVAALVGFYLIFGKPRRKA